MGALIDIDAYFRRIGYQGDGEPTLDTLRELVLRHTAAIPFENLDPLLGRPVRLDPASLEAKLVRGGRGGYCYEQNLLFRHALEGLGFRVEGLAARVLWNAPEDAVTPLTHMMLKVDLGEGSYLADVGFGAQSPTAPLRLEPDVEQATPHEPYRLLRRGGDLMLQCLIRDAWKPLYRFDLRACPDIDYEVGNWYVSTHPGSHFVTGLMAGRAAPGLRYAMLNNELAVHRLGEGTERRVLADAAAVREALEGPLGLTLPDDARLAECLARLAAGPG